ncbi:MAG: hypothetical protein ISP90_02135 [Nevskia sp.]|nr:hypothetical protein [Nevskia sp.]
MKGIPSSWFAMARELPHLAYALAAVEDLGEKQVRRLALAALLDLTKFDPNAASESAKEPPVHGLRPRNSPISLDDLHSHQRFALLALLFHAWGLDGAATLAMMATFEYGKFVGRLRVQALETGNTQPSPQAESGTINSRKKGAHHSAVTRMLQNLGRLNRAAAFIDAQVAKGSIPKKAAVVAESGISERAAATMLKDYKQDWIAQYRPPAQKKRP